VATSKQSRKQRSVAGPFWIVQDRRSRDRWNSILPSSYGRYGWPLKGPRVELRPVKQNGKRRIVCSELREFTRFDHDVQFRLRAALTYNKKHAAPRMRG
jgi:hypothetical protein